jgi:hypothetical protein
MILYILQQRSNNATTTQQQRENEMHQQKRTNKNASMKRQQLGIYWNQCGGALVHISIGTNRCIV